MPIFKHNHFLESDLATRLDVNGRFSITSYLQPLPSSPPYETTQTLRHLGSLVQLSTQSLSARRCKRNQNKLDGAIRLLLNHTLKDPSHILACLLSGQDYIYTASPVLIGEATVSLGPTLLETSVMKATSICGLAVQVTNL